jgi:tyrosyl-tRNA synthetase
VEDGAVHLPALLAEAFGISRNQARRELAGGAVKIEGQKQAPGELNVPLKDIVGKTLQLGKRRFVRVEQA